MKRILPLSMLMLSVSAAVAAQPQVSEAPIGAESPVEAGSGRDELKAELVKRTLSEAMTHVLKGGTARSGLKYDQAIASFEAAAKLFEELAPRDLQAEDKRQHLLTLQTLGELYVTTGDLAKARDAITRQQAAARQFGEAEPGKAEWRANLAGSYLRLGDVARDQGDTPAALSAFLQALQIDEGLVGASEPDAEGRSVTAHLRVGEIKAVQGDNAAARQHYDAGLRLAEKLAAAFPGAAEWQQNLAKAHFLTGRLLDSTTDHESALAAHRRALEIRSRLAEQAPKDTDRQLDLAASYDGVGAVLRAGEEPAAAVEMFGKAHAVIERLAEADPQNLIFQRELAFAKAQLAEAMFDASEYRKYDEALAIYRHSAAIRERLAAEDKTNMLWQADLAVAYDRLAGMLIANFPNYSGAGDAARDSSGALAYYRGALTINQRLAGLDPENVTWQLAVRASYRQVGWTSWTLQNRREGADYLRRARDFAAAAVAAKPANDALLTGLLFAHDDIGQMNDRSGDVKAALVAYSESLSVARQLAGRSPHDPKRQRGLWLSATTVGDLFLRLDRAEEGLAAYREGNAAIEAAVKLRPQQTELLYDLAAGQNSIGDALTRLGRQDEALAAYARRIEVTERLVRHQSERSQPAH